uniref:Uncharacterized protein n=1 Tax=viral metagenome TaxID=1070528 RepID=A0A6M3JZB2_9ZZZZ
MDIIYDIRRLVKYLYQAFGDAALWCWNSTLPLDWLGDFFLEVYNHLTDLHYSLYLFARDYEDLWDAIVNILTESDIFRILRDWLNYAENAWNWIKNFIQYPGEALGDWWQGALDTVKDLIAVAVEGLIELKVAWDSFWTITFPNWTTELLRIGLELSDFFTITLPGLLTFDWLGIWFDNRLEDIQSLINSTIQVWFPFYNDLVELWNDILEFFTDPLTWLEKKFTDWFLGEE